MKSDIFMHVAAGLNIKGIPRTEANSGQLQDILNIVFVLTGAIALLVVVLAGFRLIVSRGNPQETAKARNAIIFAVLGLVILMFAFTIVNFVLFRVG